MDVEAILARHPQVVLLDELAHTNIPGSKRRKRYEDVLELLAEKIDVVSTLNIQHIESIAPVVRSITGITVRETVPDWPAHCHRNRNGGPHSGSLAKPHEAGRRL